MNANRAKSRNLFTWVGVAVVVALVALPVLLNPGAGFAGTDDAAQGIIAQMAPGYQPWALPVFAPEGELATFLFALQAAIGAGALGYFLGLKRGETRARRTSSKEDC